MREISFDDLPDDLIPKPKFSQPEASQEVSFDDLPDAPLAFTPSPISIPRVTPDPAPSPAYSGPMRQSLADIYPQDVPQENREAAPLFSRQQSMAKMATGQPDALFSRDSELRRSTRIPESPEPKPVKLPRGDAYDRLSGVPEGIVADLSLGFYRPPEPRSEAELEGRMIGGMPTSLAMGAGAAMTGPAAPMLLSGMAFLRLANQAQDNGADFSDPRVMASISGQAGLEGAFLPLPESFGKSLLAKAATGGALGAGQGFVQDAYRQIVENGGLDLTDPRMRDALAWGSGLGVGFGAFNGDAPKRPVEINKQNTNTVNAVQPEPGIQQASDPILREASFDDLPDAPSEAVLGGENSVSPEGRRGFFDAEKTPDDMLARQWQAGNEAQTKLLEAEAAHEPVRQEHEASLRAAVEAENALRSRFPDEGVSPKFPAERDLLRALTNKYQEAETKVSETQSRFDETKQTLEEAKRLAAQAQEVPIPKMGPERLQGRNQVIKAMQDRNMTPEQIQAQIGVMDQLPQLYNADMRAAKLDEPGMMDRLGFGSKSEIPEALASSERDDLAVFQSKNKKSRPEKDLVALHNLSEEALGFSEKLGGIAVPSVGITKFDSPFKGFGDISLIGRTDLIDPENGTPVFDADAYSARFPKQEYKPGKHSEAQSVINSLRGFAEKFDDRRTLDNLYDDTVNKPDPNNSIRSLSRSRAARAAFLDSKGISIEPKLRARMPRYSWSLKDRLRKTTEGIDWSKVDNAGVNSQEYDVASKTMGEAYRKMVKENRAKDTEGFTPEDLARYDRATESIVNDIAPEGGMRFNIIEKVREDVGKAKEKEVDTDKTDKLIDSAMKGYEKEFSDWVKNKILPLHGDPYIKVNGRKSPVTLDNAVNAMTSNKVIGKENTITFGPGMARASMAKKYKSIEEIQADRDNIVSPEKHEEAKAESERVVSVYRDAALDFFNGKNWSGDVDTWAGMDASMKALAEAGKKKLPSNEDIRAALSKNGFKRVSDDVLLKARSALSSMRYAPVDYLEAKPQRGVRINEFSGAVIPKTASGATRELLKKHGVPFREYDSSKDGAREKAIAGFTQELNTEKGDILFQQSERKSVEPFFHQLQRTIEEKMPPRATPEQIRGILKGRIKSEEIEYSGLEEFLSGKEKVNKAELLSYLKEGELKIELDVRGGPDKKADERLYRESAALEKELEGYGDKAYEKYGDKKDWPDDVLDESLRILKKLQTLDSEISAATAKGRTKYENYREPNGRDYKETLYKAKTKSKSDLELEIDQAREDKALLSFEKTEAMSEWKRISEENGNNGSRIILDAYKAYMDANKKWKSAVDAIDVLEQKKGREYDSPHFEKADNTAAHSRSAKFTDENGLKLHHIEEIQSDMHQAGREAGYVSEKKDKLRIVEDKIHAIKSNENATSEEKSLMHNLIDDRDALKYESQVAIPDAPFKKSWHEMVIRRELYDAAKNGDDAMTWTGGEKQAARYDLSQEVRSINVEGVEESNGLHFVDIKMKNGKDINLEVENGSVRAGEFSGKSLPDIVGKEMSEKILAIEGGQNKTFTGIDLKIGGEGMKGFYDKIVPDYLNKYAKKWGQRVEEFKAQGAGKYKVEFENYSPQYFNNISDARAAAFENEGTVSVAKVTYQGIRITPEMRRSILEEGQSFFQKNQDGRDVGEILGAYIPKSKREKGLVLLFERANFSTVWHETIGHSLYHEVIIPDLKLSAEADRLIIRDLGESAIKDGKWTADAHEWMAKHVEQWAYDGKTDVPALIPLFKKIMAWMRDVYKDMAGGPTGKELDAEWRQFLDSAFGGKKAETAPEGAASLAAESVQGARPAGSSAKKSKSNPEKNQKIEPTQHVPGERSLPKTLEKYGIEGGSDREYEVKHLDESAKAAIEEIKEKGAETVQHAILGRAKFDPQDMPRAIALMRQWQYEADSLPPGYAKDTALEKTIQMASEMSKRATEAGQFNAMIRILERLSPDGIVYYAQKQLEKINAKLGPSKHVKMQPETATVLRNAAKELESTRELADQAKSLEAVSKKIEKGEQISVDDIAALESFKRKLSVHLGELPPERPKGILGTPGKAKPEPKPTSKPTKKPTADNAEAILGAREIAALARLKARGLKSSKALLQSITKLAEEDISDLADVFASRLAKRKASVSDIKANFVEAFGPDAAPHLDEIAQKGARRLQEARRERVKLTEVATRVDEILGPLLKGNPAEIHQAEQLKSAFEAIKTLTGDAQREAGWDIQEALGAMVPAGSGKKASIILAIAQLLNPKTLVRNIVGLELFYHAELASKWVAANGIDWPRSKLTGTDRLITFRKGGQGEYWKNLMLGSKAAMRGVNPEGLESKYDLHGFVFKDKRNPFYWAEKAMGLSLRATDYAAYKRAFNQTLGEIAELSADRKKIPSGQREAYIKKWMEDAPAEVLEIADAYGKYAIFQDPTALAKGAMGLKNFLNAGKDFGLGNFVINYPKTPANILMRAIEYSPAGLLRSLHLLSEPWRTGLPRNTREVELSLGRVLVGGAGGMLAWYLAKSGALSGQTDTDRDARNFKKEQTGEANYQVNVTAIGRWISSGLKRDQLNKRDGDTLISYDWAQPLAINAAMMATAVQALSDKKKPIEGALATFEAGIEGATKSLEGQPLLQGMERLFNSDKSIPGRLIEILEGVPASFSPTFLNQIKQHKDNSARNTQAPTAAARMINKVMYKLPFISEKLPIIYKTIGENEPREMYQNGSNTLFNVFFNPAFVAKYKVDPDIEVILNPFATEGRKNQFPKSVYKRQIQYSEKGERKSYDLTGAELSELQRRTAQETFTRFKSMNIEDLKDEPPEHQEKVLADGVNDSWNKVRKEFLMEKGIHVK